VRDAGVVSKVWLTFVDKWAHSPIIMLTLIMMSILIIMSTLIMMSTPKDEFPNRCVAYAREGRRGFFFFLIRIVGFILRE
jgi:hypothetical protein